MKPRFLAAAFVMTLTAVLPLRAQVTPPIAVHVRPGVTVKYLAVEPVKAKPSAAVILFAGGNGVLKLKADGAIATGLSENFLVRSRAKFAQRGLFVAVVDTPNQAPISGNVRLSAQYAAEIGAVILDVRSHLAAGGKVWLVGTSSGTLSTAGIAAHLPHQKSDAAGQGHAAAARRHRSDLDADPPRCRPMRSHRVQRRSGGDRRSRARRLASVGYLSMQSADLRRQAHERAQTRPGEKTYFSERGQSAARQRFLSGLHPARIFRRRRCGGRCRRQLDCAPLSGALARASLSPSASAAF